MSLEHWDLRRRQSLRVQELDRQYLLLQWIHQIYSNESWHNHEDRMRRASIPSPWRIRMWKPEGEENVTLITYFETVNLRTNAYDPCSLALFCVAARKAWKFQACKDSNPDLCNADAVLRQLSYQVKWELVLMWVYDKLVDDGYRVRR